MSNDITNLRDTIIPKSDQLNADQLLGSEMTIRVTSVGRGSGDDQPVVVHYEGENGRPYKPCKSMRKVLIFAWGENGNDWIGRMMTLYNKRDVKWGGVEVGGIRISHLSHIERDIKLSLAETKGRKGEVIVKRLDASDPHQYARTSLEAAARNGVEALRAAWSALPKAHQRAIGPDGCPANYKTIAAAADKAKAAAATPPVQERHDPMPAAAIAPEPVGMIERGVDSIPVMPDPPRSSAPASLPIDDDNPF